MPELPDLTVYVESLAERIVGRRLRHARIRNPFVLRTALPPIASLDGAEVVGLRRLGKRIVIAFAGELFLVVHLMIAGRLRWLAAGAKPPGNALAAFEFDDGVLVLTEAGSKRRASLHLVHGRTALAALDPGGADVFALDLAGFVARLRSGRHTLKRALTDPHLFSGIGNAYSDEILHRARLSPFAPSTTLADADNARLFAAARAVLAEWTERLRAQAGGRVPDKVSAFHADMAVHGRYGQPCPDCGAPVQRIVYADNETNYCARCQTGGRVLADRALSRLLHDSWPKSIDELD
ncbi:MAG TPA: DNA-formamidopyrimidine glycosylase family protein [Dokdonella sp.]